MSVDIWKVPTVQSMEVVYVTQAEGAGTEEEPVRMVVYIFNKKGDLLARGDQVEMEGRRHA